MGGLIIVVLWPLLLPLAFLYFLGVAMPIIMRVLLVWNVLLLAGLVLVRWLWKRSGAMDRSYITVQPDWKRLLLTVLKYGLLLGILWEALLVLFCVGYLVWWPELLGALLVQ